MSDLEAIWERVRRRPGGDLLLGLLANLQQDDIFGLAAEMAYGLLLAFFPLLLLLVAALGFVGSALGFRDLFAQGLNQITPFLPQLAVAALSQHVDGLLSVHAPTMLTVGILGTIWGAAGTVGALTKGLNRAYGIANPGPFWQDPLRAVAITVVLPPLSIVSLGLVLLYHNVVNWLGVWLQWSGALDAVAIWMHWPLLVLLIFSVFSLIYHFLPYRRRPYPRALPGSAVATAGWLLVSWSFSLYVGSFAHYDIAYGSFGAVIAFLLWLDLMGVALLFGAEVNALLDPGACAVSAGRRRSRSSAGSRDQGATCPQSANGNL